MKKIFTYVFPTILVFVYLLSYVGFGIHTCTCSGTTDVILLFNNLSCERIHTHIHLSHHQCENEEHHHHECDHHDDGEAECCHTRILVLTDAQDHRSQNDLINVEYQTLEHSFFIAGDFLAQSLPSDYCLSNNYSLAPPPLIYGKGALSRISQWRL